ncbi:MAG: hypothetical protein IIA70_09255 [Proteobacteria bacterium]|nr:hypothetical protein [Pseudomonadota bacterium]
MESFTQVGAAEYVGTSKQQMSRYTQMGRIRLNGDGRIDKDELDRFLEDQESKYARRRDRRRKRSAVIEKKGVLRVMVELVLPHFTSYLYENMAPLLSFALEEKKVSRKKNSEICKELYGFMFMFTDQYNDEDIFNKLLMEGGIGLDAIHFKIMGERISSKPSELKHNLPEIYWSFLTPKESAQLEKDFKSAEKKTKRKK